METVLIRHGEPDDTLCNVRGFIGQVCGLAPLTPAERACAGVYAEGPGAFRLREVHFAALYAGA